MASLCANSAYWSGWQPAWAQVLAGTLPWTASMTAWSAPWHETQVTPAPDMAPWWYCFTRPGCSEVWQVRHSSGVYVSAEAGGASKPNVSSAAASSRTDPLMVHPHRT